MKSALRLVRAVATMSCRRVVVQGAQQGDRPGLPRRRHAQVGAARRPGSGEIGMGQRLALVRKQQHNVAGLGLRLAQVQTQSHPLDRLGVLAALQRVARTPVAEPPFRRSTFERCEREINTSSRRAISPASRARVQLVRSATGALSSGTATRRAASTFTGVGPAATRVRNTSGPPPRKALRHSRTVFSCTPNASAIRGLVQPESVSRIARARSACGRSAPRAIADSALRCSTVAFPLERPAMIRPT